MCITWVWGPHWQVVLEKRPKVLKLQIGERTKVVSSRAGNKRKNERMSDSLKKTSDSLIRSFLVSELSASLTLLIKKEGMSISLIF